MQEAEKIGVWSLGWEDTLEEGMATNSSVLAWRNSRTEEHGGLRSMRSQGVGYDWNNLAWHNIAQWLPTRLESNATCLPRHGKSYLAWTLATCPPSSAGSLGMPVLATLPFHPSGCHKLLLTWHPLSWSLLCLGNSFFRAGPGLKLLTVQAFSSTAASQRLSLASWSEGSLWTL